MRCEFAGQVERTYRKQDKDNPTGEGNGAPCIPQITTVDFLALHLPATELLIEPPSVGTVSHLDVREPFAHDRYYGCIDSNANT